MLFPDCTTHMQSSCLCNCAVYLEACQSVWAWQQVTVLLALRLNREFMVCTLTACGYIWWNTKRPQIFAQSAVSGCQQDGDGFIWCGEHRREGRDEASQVFAREATQSALSPSSFTSLCRRQALVYHPFKTNKPTKWWSWDEGMKAVHTEG